jgi:drug/metabolite transporter (DMT)-like permease
MQNQKKAYLFAILSVLLWSTVATAFKTALLGMAFPMLLFISTFISFIVLLLLVIYKNQFINLFKISCKDFLRSAVLGFLNPFLYYLVLLKAYSILPAQIAQPLNYIWPVVLVVLSAPFLGHKIQFRAIMALLISFAGVIIISMQGKLSFSFSNPLGVFLAIGSSVIWALFWILNLKDSRDEVLKLCFSFFWGLIFISFYLFFNSFTFPSSGISFVASVYVGCFEMGVTFILWLTALKLSQSPEKISSLVFLSPFLSIFFIAIFLNEVIHFSTVLGLCFIICGIILSKTRFKTK